MKYWIGTVSKEHVLRGVAGGFCQVCHGKAAPLNRMQRGDWLLYYSPKIRLDGHDKLQSFTALGQITDDQAYPFQMSASFIPFRRNVAYAEIRRECPIAVIRTHPEWKNMPPGCATAILKLAEISSTSCAPTCWRSPKHRKPTPGRKACFSWQPCRICPSILNLLNLRLPESFR